MPTSQVNNPPHLVARDRYEEIVPNPVVCTGEYPGAEEPRPVVFGLEPGAGLVLLDPDDLEEGERDAEAAKSAPGSGGALLAALGGVALAAGAAWAARRRQQGGTAAVREAVEQERGTDAAPATTVGFGRQ